MSTIPFGLAAAFALAAPICIAVLSTRRRGAELPEQAGAVLLGCGAVLVCLWYLTGLMGLGTGSVALAGVLGSLVAATDVPRRARQARQNSTGHTMVLLVAGLILAGAVLVPFLPYGMTRPDGVHRFAMTDWEKHLMFATELIAFDEVPPRNPYLRGSGPSPYYAGYQLLAALPARAIGEPTAAYPALLALTLATALLLPAVAYSLARSMGVGRGTALIAAGGAAFLGGFDLLALGIDSVGRLVTDWPEAVNLGALREIVPSVNPDYWLHHNERQFDPPYRNAIWAPQHLLAALLGVTILTRLWPSREGAPSARSGIVLGFGLAATAMLSAYTAIALGVGLAAAAMHQVVASRGWRGIPSVWAVTGATALAVGLPFARQLAASPFAGLEVAVSSAGSWRNGALLSSWFGDHTMTRLLDSPAVLVVELGVIGILGIAGLRASGTARSRSVGVFLVAVIVLVVVVRPPLGAPNNLYPRGLTLVWLLLAPFAASAAIATRSWRRRAAAVALVLCLVYVPYAALGATLEGYLFWPTPHADHAVARWVEASSPPGTVVAIRPEQGPVYFTYWARRPIVFDDERLALVFGATATQVAEVQRSLDAAYEQMNPRAAAASFRELGADLVVVAAATDAANSWAASGCFVTSYRRDGWLVAAPEPESCDR